MNIKDREHPSFGKAAAGPEHSGGRTDIQQRDVPLDFRHLAQLACLELSEAEAETYEQDIKKILAYVETLRGLETAGVPPTGHALERKNVWRGDAMRRPVSGDGILANAPDGQNGWFRVPGILET
jgi:aspartyl-tRNA(Asn)/glutamyl-tRNA(Gln) amidotransferase subunit C